MGLGHPPDAEGWLYNVSGMEAVEIALRSGKMLRIGSDEASVLADALLH